MCVQGNERYRDLTTSVPSREGGQAGRCPRGLRHRYFRPEEAQALSLVPTRNEQPGSWGTRKTLKGSEEQEENPPRCDGRVWSSAGGRKKQGRMAHAESRGDTDAAQSEETSTDSLCKVKEVTREVEKSVKEEKTRENRVRGTEGQSW
jgi:hypothetical protein